MTFKKILVSRYNYLIISGLLLQNISAQVSNQATLARISEAEIQLQEKYMEGMVNMNIGKMDAAAQAFQAVLDKNPKCDGCFFQLSRIASITGESPKALDFAKKAVAIDDRNKWYKMALAEAYEKQGKDREAADIYRSLTESAPFGGDFNDEIYFRLAYSHVRMAEPQKAIKVLDDLEKKVGVTEDISTKKVTVFEAMKEPKKAAVELKKLADKYPQAVDYQHLAADYFLKIGDKSGAMAFYQRILKIDPTNSKAQLATATAQKPPSASNSSGEMAFLKSLKDLFRKPDIRIDDKIKTFLPFAQKIADGRDKNLASAGLELAQIIEQTHPTEAKSYSLLGDMLYYNGKTAEAIEKYKRCTQINKAIYPVWEQLMYAQEELALFDDLAQSSETTMDLFPNQANAFFFNGLANEKRGKFPDAISSLQQAILMASKKPNLKHDALIELGVTYSKSKNYEQADRAFDDALKLNNKSSIALIKYAISLQQRGTADRAKTMADEALKISMETDPSVLELYGDYLFKANDKDNALNYWTKAKTLGAKSVLLDKKIAEKSLVE